MANHVLSHLTGLTIKESSDDLESNISFTKKELNIISYLSGYVFGTFSDIYESRNHHRVCLVIKVYRSCWRGSLKFQVTITC